MQPFTKHFFIVILAFAAAYLAGYFIPEQPLVLDILLRGSAFAVVYLALITGLRISSDVNSTIRLILAQTGIKK